MQGSPRPEREWEHWPGRSTGDDGVRSRLRSLFVPTDSGDAITELIAAHSRELEARAEGLRVAIAELEQRETRARNLHARVEQVLREGSAELDVRHSDLAARATDLERREAAVAEAESRAQERAQELGAVELRSAAVERRAQQLDERETELARRERALQEREARLERRAAELDTVGGKSGGQEALPSPANGYVMLTTDHGYRLLEREGAAPAMGDTLDLDGGRHRCVRLVTSPFPNDPRPCAVLERLPPSLEAS